MVLYFSFCTVCSTWLLISIYSNLGHRTMDKSITVAEKSQSWWREMTFFRSTLASPSANQLSSQWAWPRKLVRLDRKEENFFFFFLPFWLRENVLEGFNAWIHSGILIKTKQNSKLWEMYEKLWQKLWILKMSPKTFMIASEFPSRINPGI